MVSYMPAFYGKHKFWRFVLPDDLSLKVIFDNVRNYGIAAGVIFSGRYYNQVDGASSWPVWILVGAGIVLVLLNSLQSWVLLLNVFHHFPGFSHEEMASRSRRAGWSLSIKSLLLLGLLFLLPVGIWKFISVVLRQVFK
ncbi:MAG TPA: hypothetical protein VN310_00550 [Candidatus Dormibacteraeota bacterium]|jgi:hypothetical protein|nr:hypothetical protein [Candidatus Dormibacteraeota bacterium]